MKNTNVMNTINNGTAKFGFVKKAQLIQAVEEAKSYEAFEGHNTAVKYVMPKSINLNLVKDKVKLFSYNYAVAGAVGIITDGVYKFLAANNAIELSKTVKDFGKEAIKGQRYTAYSRLIRGTRVVSRLGGGTMRLSICSAYEVVEFFRRLKQLDVNALTDADVKAMKADMQVVGRVIQEIAIDAAKNKDLSSGIDPMNTFGSIMVLSKIRAKFTTALTDNRAEIFTAVRESISKTQSVNAGVVVESIPNYELKFSEIEKEHIVDWAAKYQDGLVATQNEFMNTEVMDVVKKAGTTRDDLEIANLVLSKKPFVDEVKKLSEILKAYKSTLIIENSNDAENNARNAIARRSADKEILAAFRDHVYALGRAYNLSEADTRKLVYGSTMLANGGINVANANMSSIDLIGEEDMLLMWSNEQGIVRDSVEVEIAEDVLATMDLTKEISFRAEFIDDVAYDADGNEIAYGAFDNLNCAGTIELVGHKFMFTPDRDTNVAPIGTKRVALISQIVVDGELTSIYKETRKVKDLFELAETPEDLADAKEQEAKLDKAIQQAINVLLMNKDNLFFVGKTNAGVENAVCVRVFNNNTGKLEPATIAKTTNVGVGYGVDLFNKGLTKTLEDGRVVTLTNKSHKLENIIKTDRGLVVSLSC